MPVQLQEEKAYIAVSTGRRGLNPCYSMCTPVHVLSCNVFNRTIILYEEQCVEHTLLNQLGTRLVELPPEE